MATAPMISGVRDAAGASSGAAWVKARNAWVLPLVSAELSDMGTTIAKGCTYATVAADHRHQPLAGQT